LPILGDAGHTSMIHFMKQLPSRIAKPDAVLVISAHWGENDATVLGNPAPSLFYDYYGFPPEAYHVTYPAPGSPGIAKRITDILEKSGISSNIDRNRGFDHGLFIPMKMMYPEADIPMLQISLIRGLSPQKHIALGKALRSLLDEKILVIGSGFSFHNMNAFSWDHTKEDDPKNDAFQSWLIDVCAGTHAQKERERQLIEWDKAPHARYCHPREEHLLPLHVCVGLTQTPAELIFDDLILGKRAVAFKW